MKQTRQAVCAVKQSILLRCLWFEFSCRWQKLTKLSGSRLSKSSYLLTKVTTSACSYIVSCRFSLGLSNSATVSRVCASTMSLRPKSSSSFSTIFDSDEWSLESLPEEYLLGEECDTRLLILWYWFGAFPELA
jgi:hypothetical protein